MHENAVVLLSGGIDSSTTLAAAKRDGFTTYALTIDYNQRHKIELTAACKIAKHLEVEQHKIIFLDLRTFGGSALTSNLTVPKNRTLSDIVNPAIAWKAGILEKLTEKEILPQGIPLTYVPARNTIFLALALAWAEVLDAFSIFIGANAIDYSGYPDCRPEFIQAFQQTANLGTKRGIEGAPFQIKAPLINMTKAEIIQLGVSLGVDYSLTFSCYDPSPRGEACGACDSCLIRRRGFLEAGIPDPTLYRDGEA